MSDIYIKEHRHNTLGKMSTEILLKDIGAQLAHIADELHEMNHDDDIWLYADGEPCMCGKKEDES